MIKKEWLNESVWVDEFGRPYNLSDVPMTYMTREESYKKQGISKKDINKFWEEFKNDKTKKS